MPRRVDIPTVEMGKLKLFLIYSDAGTWEPTWQPLQGDPITSLFTLVTKESLDHALRGWTRPLITSLGIPPEGALKKLGSAGVCHKRHSCIYYVSRDCLPQSKAMPWCFEPDGIDARARILATEVIQYWRDGVRVAVVEGG